MNEIHNQIVNMSYAYFSNKKVTPEEIRSYIQRMQKAYEGEGIKLDEAWLFAKIESIHFVSVGEAKTLDDLSGHEDWFNPSTNQATRREIVWHFWSHYREYQINQKGWPTNVVASLDRLSSEILSRIEDPQRQGIWDRRGMVMGSVQSGKTANYTALICKAADAGYKLFIVLTGVHNSLRSQTQTRINEEFLGYDLDKVQRLTGGEKRIGVRKIFSDHNTVYTLTSSSQGGDFKRVIASQIGLFPSKDSHPIILIIKKTVPILDNLISWLPSLPITKLDASSGRRYIPDIPMMVIDDECDYASVNTQEPERDEDGKIIPEWDPAATNRKIRELLFMFEKSVYVGYTATPYANIFIHMDEKHERYGEDLFPRSFIISLPQPSNYLGPERLFGLEADPNRGVEEIEPLPLIRIVEDHLHVIPGRPNREQPFDSLPDSLKQAMKCFLLTCAARMIRAEGTPHNSMLVHITRFTIIQQQVYDHVERELKGLVARIMSGKNLEDFHKIWEEDFLQTTRRMKELGFNDSIEHSWDDVLKNLHKAARLVRIKLINGTAQDALEYKDTEIHAKNRINEGEDVPWEERGLNVIAIGGDKLSRGLTLEGLTISYYLRTSRMYDTLMQMGRWFGYKQGYSDLCRIFTTDELLFWYRQIAGATVELREEIEYMAALGETPENFGLKIRTHPGRLIVTSAGKSRRKQRIFLSYDQKISETIVYDPRYSQNNRQALERLINEIGRKPHNIIEPKKSSRLHWSGISAGTVINFLHLYKTHDTAKRVVDPEIMARYIERQNGQKELITWDVVVVSNPDGKYPVNIAGYKIACMIRNPLFIPTNDKISIGRLVSPHDELSDMHPDEIANARKFDIEHGKILGEKDDPSGIAIRRYRPKERGLLLIYIIHGERDGKSYGNKGDEVVGLAISFPRSDTAVPLEYWVNPVYIEEQSTKLQGTIE